MLKWSTLWFWVILRSEKMLHMYGQAQCMLLLICILSCHTHAYPMQTMLAVPCLPLPLFALSRVASAQCSHECYLLYWCWFFPGQKNLFKSNSPKPLGVMESTNVITLEREGVQPPKGFHPTFLAKRRGLNPLNPPCIHPWGTDICQSPS